MDRTSILGDTIDYVKELMERIKTLEEEMGATPEELNLLSTTRNFSSGSNEEMMPTMRNSTRVSTLPVQAQIVIDHRNGYCAADPILIHGGTRLQFVVEKRGGDGGTSIEICCATNPGVLLSTVSALEVLGLEIEQCVVSCFGDFAMQASCSQVSGQSRTSEALFSG